MANHINLKVIYLSEDKLAIIDSCFRLNHGIINKVIQKICNKLTLTENSIITGNQAYKHDEIIFIPFNTNSLKRMNILISYRCPDGYICSIHREGVNIKYVFIKKIYREPPIIGYV